MSPVLAPKRPRVWSLCPRDNTVIASRVVSLFYRGLEQAQSGRHVAQGGSPGSALGLRTPPCICCLPRSQPHPDEGHPPPLEAVPVPWKSVGPCKSHRESPGGLAETPGGEEAQGEEGPAAGQLDVLRLRSSSMEIREKGSEFLKEELHKAQKVGLRGWRGQGAHPEVLWALPEHLRGGRCWVRRKHRGETSSGDFWRIF